MHFSHPVVSAALCYTAMVLLLFIRGSLLFTMFVSPCFVKQYLVYGLKISGLFLNSGFLGRLSIL